MNEVVTANHLQEFMLRLDRVAPPQPLRTGFELALAACVLQAHLDFLRSLDWAAAPPDRAGRLRLVSRHLRRAAKGFQRCLLALWLSRTLSPSSKSGEALLGGACREYANALDHGHALLSLLVPSSTGWYDATTGKTQIARSTK